MKALFILTLLCPLLLSAWEINDIEAAVQQSALYFQSDQVTIAGVGGGLSLETEITSRFFARTGMNILWINGNALETKLSLGYQQPGTWNPAICGTGKLLWGHRTVIINEDGSLPDYPTWMLGISIAPLRFRVSDRHLSALEMEAGIGAYKGMMLSLQVLSVGM